MSYPCWGVPGFLPNGIQALRLWNRSGFNHWGIAVEIQAPDGGDDWVICSFKARDTINAGKEGNMSMMDTPVGIHRLNHASGMTDKNSHNTAEVGLEAGQSLGTSLFTALCSQVSRLAGSSRALVFAAALVLCWLLSGPIFRFSDTWQLVINTGTTIITFLMVFLIQNTQNRDSEALHLKLDVLLLSNPQIKKELVNLEELSQEELDKLKTRLLSHIRAQEKGHEGRQGELLPEDAVN
jgi:low affinity Fe/Cu permease